MYSSIILLYSLQKQHASASGLRSQAVQALCIFSRQQSVGNSYQAGTSDSNDHTVRTSFAAGGNHRPVSITEYQAHHKTIPSPVLCIFGYISLTAHSTSTSISSIGRLSFSILVQLTFDTSTHPLHPRFSNHVSSFRISMSFFGPRKTIFFGHVRQ